MERSSTEDLGIGVMWRPGFHTMTGPLWAGTAAMLFAYTGRVYL